MNNLKQRKIAHLSQLIVLQLLAREHLPCLWVGLQRYIFPRYDTYLDKKATIRYDTLLCATKPVTNNLHYF